MKEKEIDLKEERRKREKEDKNREQGQDKDSFIDGPWLNESKSGKAVQIDLGYCWLIASKQQLLDYLHGESEGFRFSMIVKD